MHAVRWRTSAAADKIMTGATSDDFANFHDQWSKKRRAQADATMLLGVSEHISRRYSPTRWEDFTGLIYKRPGPVSYRCSPVDESPDLKALQRTRHDDICNDNQIDLLTETVAKQRKDRPVKAHGEDVLALSMKREP